MFFTTFVRWSTTIQLIKSRESERKKRERIFSFVLFLHNHHQHHHELTMMMVVVPSRPERPEDDDLKQSRMMMMMIITIIINNIIIFNLPAFPCLLVLTSTSGLYTFFKKVIFKIHLSTAGFLLHFFFVRLLLYR